METPAHDQTTPPPPDPSVVFVCPGCATDVEVVQGDVAQLIRCPACDAEFLVPSVGGSSEPPAPPDYEAPEAPDVDELDALRIRNLSVARRAAIRSRSYMLIGAAACLIGAVKLVLMTIEEAAGAAPRGPDAWSTGYVLLAAVALAASVYFMRRATQIRRELAQPTLSEPTAPPDFSTLSDGSQRWKNLEEVR
ncbi:MAG: hypothetical protein ACREIT_06500 [Tepidisphaeraceae bacterium]